MLIKKINNKHYHLIFLLNKQFSKQYLSLKKDDEISSMQAIHMLVNYIRYCLFENYQFKNKDKLSNIADYYFITRHATKQC